MPTAIRTTLGSCLAIEGVKSPKTRSCYEYHPPGRSKAVRTAVGRSVFPADGTGRTSKPAAGEGEPADRRARQEQKKSPPGSSGGLETFIGGVSADLEPAPLLSAVPVDCARHTTNAHVVLML